MATSKNKEQETLVAAAKALEVATDELDSAQRRGIATQKELLEIQVKIAEAALNNAIAEGKLGRELDSFRVIVESTRKAVEDYTTAQEELADAAAAGELAFNQLAGSVLQLNGPLGRLSGLLDGNGKSFGKFIASAKDSIKSGELLKNTVLKLVDANLKFALRQNEAIAGFRAATGAGAEFNEVIRQTERATFAAGVTVNDSTAAITSLKNEFTDFTYLNEGQQRGLKNTTVLLQKMGFSFSTQTAIIQNSSQAMGMSLDESQALLLDIASTARSLGMDIEELGQSFNTNIEFITRFGSDGQKVFEELAVSAKALGTDIDTLVSVVDKFKTFDGAATHVGRLNAILGGPFLNSIDMMNAAFEDPTEGINLLRDGFDAAGRSIEDISGAELEAIASAMGMSLSETKKILGKSNEEMEIYRLNQSDLAEQAMVTQSITEQLTATFGQFYANLGPIIDHILVPMVTWLGGVAQSIGDIINTIPSFVAGLGMAGAAVGALIGLSLGLTAAIPGVGIAMAATSAAAVLGYVALGTALGGGVGAIAGSLFSQPEGTGKTKSMTPQYATGGVVTGTTTAIVGENGPEMVEMPTGSRVTTAPATKQLTDAIMKLSNKLDNVGGGENIQLAVYIGKEKVDEIVVNAINSRAGRAAFSPFSNA
tara:strand:+ start:1755 stop:3713 length:1959 start_codon:yes stop_codon:yes gene_type:complete